MLDLIDVEVDDDGDLVVNARGNLKIATAQQTIVQNVINRIRTGYNDYMVHPTFGSNVSSMKGRPNTRENSQLISQMVVSALTIDGRFTSSEFFVDVLPISFSAVLINVIFNHSPDNAGRFAVSATLNYDTGVIEMIAGPDQQGSGSL